MTTRRSLDRLERVEAATSSVTHQGIIIARTSEEAYTEIERRIREGGFNLAHGALIIPPDLSVDEWERRYSPASPETDET